MGNKITISGEIGWNVTARDIKAQLKGMKGDIDVDLSSPGGSIYQGIEIFNAFKAYDKGNINMIITGLAASMGSYIALAGDKVSAFDNATYMIHNGWAFTWGDHNELRETANILESLSGILANAYASKTGKSKNEIKKMMDAETYLFGAEIKDAGFIDEIISTESDDDKSAMIAMAKQSFKECVASSKEHAQEEKEENGKLAALISTVATMPSANEKIANNSQGEAVIKTVEALANEYPELVKAIKGTAFGEGKKEGEKLGKESAKIAIEKATASERARFAALDELLVEGCEQIISDAKASGASEGDTAILIAKAVKAQKPEKDLEKALGGNSDDIADGSGDDAQGKSLEDQVIQAIEKGDK